MSRANWDWPHGAEVELQDRDHPMYMCDCGHVERDHEPDGVFVSEDDFCYETYPCLVPGCSCKDFSVCS